ncbi:helix-turn-helix domain-containing protein [Propylenella binzhouense]|uniref:Chromosomal replication initiator DnaA n=1 Tax=Propylenella binzhouense TaxID=2555902 RepID=A0A964T567_9HYPH|nr:helix-turn-helix domain-containing protein [Propylenella binzhouense]MYZ48370.1 chromosomal replication initiator DnaA [Propylenella binzhouense]
MTDLDIAGRPGRGGRDDSAGEVASGCRAAETLVVAALRVRRDAVRARRRGTAKESAARQIAMYLAHTSLGFSLSAIGRQFGRDRTTVAHAIARIEDRRDDPAFDRLLDYLSAALELWVSAFQSGGGA